MEKIEEIFLRNKVTPPPISSYPAISVIIPLYNAEQFVGECLDSVLNQTFQNFEVIVVDDCSTDNSCAVVESFIPKFNGRLTLYHTEKNSGGGGYVPRNIGLNLASGEYVIFIDADDFILLNALEILYNAAKGFDAEVVYTGSYYDLRNPNDIYLHRDGEGKKLLKEGLEDKPELRIEDQKENLSKLLLEEREGNFRAPWSKFARRNFLIKNKILFPTQMTNGADFIWVIDVYCHAKKFLRIPTPFYFYKLYNTASVSQTKRKSSQQIFHWISAFIDFMKGLRELEKKNEVLRENPAYCLAAMKSHFNWCLNRTKDERNELSSAEIYEILWREFAKDSSEVAVPFFFSFIDNERRTSKENLKTITDLKKQLEQLKNSLVSPSDANKIALQNLSACPAISVVIPMYNSEKYIGECLDSILNQTFQNFEVIVVDDCSTDSSYSIVESYKEKFGGRLTLAKMEKNSGGGALPRNKGLSLSRGEYIFFVDSDDMITKTALEDLCALLRKYNADIVYCEKFYAVDDDGANMRVQSYQRGGFVDKPTFDTEDLSERVQGIINDRYLTLTVNKLIKRKLIVDNEIFFPALKTSEDNIWNQGLLFHAKKFLRVPNIVYLYRQSKASSQREERTSQQKINFWLNPVLLGLKALDKMMSRHEFFKANPSCRYALLKNFVEKRFAWTMNDSKKLNEEIIFSTIKEEFGGRLGEYDVLISALCTALYNEKKINDNNYAEIINKFRNFFTAKIFLQMEKKTDPKNLQIISVSDKKAKISKPEWHQKAGVCHMIDSFTGNLEIAAKAAVEGKIQVRLSGLWVQNPKNKSKLVPHWIDYTKLIVNGKKIFDTVTPAWNGKPYIYTLDVKAGEKVKIETEWLPHREDSFDVLAKIETPQEPKKVSVPPKVQEQKNYNETIRELSDHSTARADIQLVPEADGDFKILSISDEKSDIRKPAWLQRNGIGYVIQSYAGKLEFTAKTTAGGQINLRLRGLDVRSPKDKTKKIPHWIDYTKFIVNDKIIFDEITPACLEKFYSYNFNVKAGEEIKIQLEWLPHGNN